MKTSRLSSSEIKKYLKYPFYIECFENIDSTSTYARKLIDNKSNDILICADSQTSGRGRRGNSFISNYDGCYFTFGLHLNYKMDEVSLITIRAAIAIVRALKKAYNIDLQIKWVNDLFFGNKKCGGILTEAILDIDGNIKSILVGVGINVNQNKFDDSIKNIASSIAIENWDKNAFVANIVNEFKDVQLLANEVVLKEYEEKLVILNKKIIYSINGVEYQGIVKGINELGNLIVLENDNTRILSSGEISLSSNKISNLLK